MIESLVGIAQGLHKQTIAEGVEDSRTQLFLRRMGVDLAQGYHVGKPQPVARVLGAKLKPAGRTSRAARRPSRRPGAAR